LEDTPRRYADIINLTMSAVGSVVFSASQGYDADVWDDSALIQAYDRAWQSSRELVRKRQEKGKGKKVRAWQIGDACRAVYSVDGEEYEGTVVHRNTANRSVTVRFHGYNNEEEVKERELMDSLGQEEIDQQVEQANYDLEDEEEEEGAGEEFQLGDWCRAEWSQDGLVYEAIIESLDRKNGSVMVKFLGFGNVEEKSFEELFMSKGEDRRREQEEVVEDKETGQGIKEEELHNLIAKNCPDLLANFGESGDMGMGNLDIGLKKNKKEKKEKKEKKAKKEKKEKKDKSSSSPSRSSQSSSHVLPDQMHSSRASTQAPPDYLPSWVPPTSMPMQSPFTVPPHFPTMPPMQPQFPSMSFPSFPDPYQTAQSPFLPTPPQLNFPPSSLPPPPSLSPADISLVTTNSAALHSMLMSWYMAGYHTGVFEGIKQSTDNKKKKK